MTSEQPINLPRLSQCPYCGERLWVQDRFCPNCGSNVRQPDGAEALDAPDERDEGPEQRATRLWRLGKRRGEE